MHKESRVYIGGQFGTAYEVVGERAGLRHKGAEAKKIIKSADARGYYIYDGTKTEKIEGYNLRTKDEQIKFHVSVLDIGNRDQYQAIAEAAEEQLGKAPVTVVVY